MYINGCVSDWTKSLYLRWTGVTFSQKSEDYIFNEYSVQLGPASLLVCNFALILSRILPQVPEAVN